MVSIWLFNVLFFSFFRMFEIFDMMNVKKVSVIIGNINIILGENSILVIFCCFIVIRI